MFYVYAWYNKKTKEIFYVGKGCRDRYKQVRNRNKLFMNYYNNNDCDVKIIKYFDSEQEAFEYEHKHIVRLKKKGQCSCNLDNGGTGGVNFIWTDEMREYKSEYNPMKASKHRKRMSKNNPMKDENISMIVGEKHKRKIVINGTVYAGTIDASRKIGVATNTILNWCKRGYDTNGNPCRYYDEEQKEYTYKKSSSRPVFVDDIRFESVKEAAKYLGINYSESLIRAIKANRKFKGHICRYDNQ